MLRFCCIRCGTQLQVDESLAGREVRCVHCTNVVRTPEGEPDVPVAERAVPIVEAADEVQAPPAGLAVPIPGTPLWQVMQEPTDAAEQPVAVTSEAATTTECQRCGSEIDASAGQCPYCGHAIAAV